MYSKAECVLVFLQDVGVIPIAASLPDAPGHSLLFALALVCALVDHPFG